MKTVEEAENSMAELKTYKCDVCPSVKKEHEGGWFRAFTRNDDVNIIIITGWDVELTTEELHFIPDQEQKHLCSESCAIKLMSQTIGSGTTQDEEPEIDREAFLRG